MYYINDMATFDTQLRKIITERQIQAKVLCQDLGFHTGSFSRWYRGKTKPNINVVAKIAQYLQVSIDYFNEIDVLNSEPKENILFDILDQLPVGVAIIKGTNFVYTHINKFLADFNGVSPEGHIDRRVIDIVNPKAVDNVINNLMQVRDSKESAQERELIAPLPNGEVRNLLYWLYWLEGKDSILVVVVDITEQKLGNQSVTNDTKGKEDFSKLSDIDLKLKKIIDNSNDNEKLIIIDMALAIKKSRIPKE